MSRNGYVWDLPDGGTRALVPVNPETRDARDAAGKAYSEAHAARVHFQKANSEGLAEEESARKARRFRKAVESDDFAEVQAALADRTDTSSPPPPRVLTTNSLRAHRRHEPIGAK